LEAFYFIFLPIYLARASNIMLIRSGESKHPCLVSDLKGKAFRLSLLSMMLAMSFSYMAFYHVEEGEIGVGRRK
jgi:hypothetical protein